VKGAGAARLRAPALTRRIYRLGPWSSVVVACSTKVEQLVWAAAGLLGWAVDAGAATGPGDLAAPLVADQIGSTRVPTPPGPGAGPVTTIVLRGTPMSERAFDSPFPATGVRRVSISRGAFETGGSRSPPVGKRRGRVDSAHDRPCCELTYHSTHRCFHTVASRGTTPLRRCATPEWLRSKEASFRILRRSIAWHGPCTQ